MDYTPPMSSTACGEDKSDPSRPPIGVVLPALDEERALPAVLDELPATWVDRVVVVDNGSTDATADVARAAGAEVVAEPTRGYGMACLTGLAALARDGGPGRPALGADSIVVFLDADHSDFPEDLPDLLAPLLEGRADFVIGSRVLGGATMSALLPQAWFGNRLACFLMRALFGARYTDLGPFRAIRRGVLDALEMGDRDFGWTIEMQLKAHTHRVRTVEVPVRYRERIGQSKITGTISGTLRAGFKILGWILRWRLRLWGRGPRRGSPSSRG